MDEIAIRIEHVSKEYRLGAIGGGTLRGDLQSWMARMKGKEDPNSKIGSDAATHMGEKFLALDDVSFEVKKGEALGIIGHNGAGKSTLLKLLSRVTAPTKGTISYNGRIASMLEVGTGFHPELTGRENVYMNGAILGMTKAEIDRKFDQIVEFAEMEKFIDTPVKRYSSGMYVKLAFAVAAHLDSEIMVMDEVLAVGDMKFQQKCLGKMGDAANSEGRTVLYVSHNMNTIRQLCTRCIVLDHGKLIFDGDVEKAIEIYMDADKNGVTKASYQDYQRPSWLQRDEIRIVSAEHLNNDNSVVSVGAKVQVRLIFNQKKHVKNVGIRCEILTLAGDAIATAMSGKLSVAENKGIKSMVMDIPTNGLVPGDYKFIYTMFEYNEFGNSRVIDCVPGLQLTISDVRDGFNLINWDTAHWGHIRLPDLQIRLEE